MMLVAHRRMVLRPLEFADCLSDNPWFRQNLHEHEMVLEDAHKNIKNIESQCRELIQCSRKLSAAQRSFARALKDFKFVTIGSTQTDDERKIGECLSKFGDFINQIEDHREKIIEDSEAHYIEPLRKFRIEGIGKVLHEDKKRYEKESNKYYASLEKHLHLSTTRKNDFKEADAQLGMQQRNFWKYSLDYVTAIQELHERMKFECVETLSSFLYSWLTFYHVGHVTHEDFKPFFGEVQSKVQKAKQSYDETKEYYLQLKEKMLTNHLKNAKVFQPENSDETNDNTTTRSVSSIKQGYMFVHEKSKIPKTIGRDVLSNRWTMYYCVYQKETRIFTMIPVNTTARTDMKGATEQSISFKLKSCTRRASDSIDKRFCFDVLVIDRTEPITLQAVSEEDRRQWLDAMDGREPIYSPGTGPTTNCLGTALDDTGFEFVLKCLQAIEEKGIKEQGLYRNCGVTSKVQKLMQIGLDKRRTANEKLSFIDDEWETKTLSSAVKTFLRNLPEPLMTFDLHAHFINAAKMDSKSRISHIHYFVHKLPKIHFDMLRIIIEHLKKVADHSHENLMTVGNLGVCFGPTLLRPKEETMAAIMDIKFCNVVVEVLIANFDLIFNHPPLNIDSIPCPPKPEHPEDSVSENSSAFSEQSSTMSKGQHDERRALADAGTDKRRQLLSSVHVRQRPPPIYDRVARSYADGDEEVPVSPSSRLVLTYGKASTSAGTSPVTPTAHNNSMTSSATALTRSTTRFLSGRPSQSVSHAQTRSANKDVCEGRLCVGSSESLNSIASGSEPPLSPQERQRQRFNDDTSHERPPFSRSRMGYSYAPAYNPMTAENSLPSTTTQNADTTTPTNASGDVHHKISSPLPFSKSYRALFAPSKSVHGLYGHSSIARNAGKDSVLDEFRHKSVLTYMHPYGSLQPSRRVRTLYVCTAGHDTELSFQPGQIITNVHESKEDGWLVGTLNGKTGLIPANYVQLLP